MHDPYGQKLGLTSKPEDLRAFISRKEDELRSSGRARVDTSERDAMGREDITEARGYLAAQGNA